MKKLTKPIICCGFTPCVQRIVEFKKIEKGAVNRACNVSVGIGGKGANTARMISQLGGETLLLGFSGGANGRHLERMLESEGVPFRHVEVAGETRVCQTLVEEGNPDTTELVEEMPAVSAADWSHMIGLIRSLDLADTVIAVSGKLPAGAPEEGYAEICKMACEQGGQVILDAQGVPLLEALEFAPLMVKINESELFQATGLSDIEDACNELLKRGARSVFITRGSRSAIFVDHTQMIEVSPLTVKAVNPIGSGDAVTAGIACALASGTDLEGQLRQGMACGAANALNLMSGVLKTEDVDRLRSQVDIREI